MNRQYEEEEYTIQEHIEQDVPPSTPKQIALGIIGVLLLLGLPTIIELAAGERPDRF